MAAAYWKPVRGLCRNGRCHHNCIDWWPASFPNGTESDRAQTVCWSRTSAWLWAHFPVCSANRLNPKISKLYFKGVGEALMKHPKTFIASLKGSNDLWCLLSSVSSVTSNKDAHHGHKTHQEVDNYTSWCFCQQVIYWHTFIFYIYISISRCFYPKWFTNENITSAVHPKKGVT